MKTSFFYLQEWCNRLCGRLAQSLCGRLALVSVACSLSEFMCKDTFLYKLETNKVCVWRLPADRLTDEQVAVLDGYAV